MLFQTALTLLLLTACSTEPSNPYRADPKIEQYAKEVQLRAAGELKATPPSCPRTHVIADCSAVKLLVNDYKTMRDKLRVE